MSERDMFRLLQLVERNLGRGWIEAADWIRSLPANSLEAIERRLIAGDISGAVAEVEQAALQFAAETQAAYTQAGRASAKWLDDQPALRDRLVRFDASGSRVQEFARRNQLELVQGMRDETRDVVRQVMATSTERNPRAWARDIRDSISLTPHQAQHVMNYRRALQQGDYANALGRELRDARSDAMLRRLADGNSTLKEEQIDRLVERYRSNYVAYRADTIARTESARNVHAGLDESFRQAIERGDVEADALTKEWIPGPRNKDARPHHRDDALLTQRPRVGEAFVLSNGVRMMYPGTGPVDEIANCRCTYATTLR